MIVTSVTVFVKEESIQSFIDATIKNHEGSIKEEGNIRFDFLQSCDDPTRFLLYEVYRSVEDVNEHKKTAHYLKWREEVDSIMAKTRVGVAHNVICPLDVDNW
ncbi:MAG: antibiotic biosynthesis monooxygenase [Candidatus Aureabacteria bacterium]|nr:antibiotic biosynthesis monooxygenase [Candidatus Auribacterota bacterium]